MAKILVKQVQPQLMQSPGKEGKTFREFAGTLFANPFNPKNRGIGVKQRLAGLAGLAGKGLAGLSTAQKTMSAMQGGDISAPLSAGYTYEAEDPTGRMISNWADPNARNKAFNVKGHNEVPLPPEFRKPPATAAPQPAAPVPTTVLPANPTTDHLNYQSPPAAPAMPQMPQMPPPLPVEPIPPLPAPAATQSGPVGTPQDHGFAPASAAQPSLVTGPNPPPVPSHPAPGYPVKPDFDINQSMMENPNDPNDPNKQQKSFVTALTEKLGADVVYKMSPHEIGTFAAYTLLKLR